MGQCCPLGDLDDIFLYQEVNLNKISYFYRVVQIIVLKSRDGYNAQNVAIPIYGYAPIGVRPKQDGVRSVNLSYAH